MNPDLLSAIGSLASVAVAIIAAVVAYFAWKTAQSATAATAALTEIESARWHSENRPEFQMQVVGVVEDNSMAVCTLTLTGSRSLNWINVVATIRPFPFSGKNDVEPGPYRWDPMTDFYYAGPHESKPFRMVVGEDIKLFMEAATDEEWHRYTHSIRLWLRCVAESGDSWMVPVSCKLVPVQLADGIITRDEINRLSDEKWAHLQDEPPVP